MSRAVMDTLRGTDGIRRLMVMLPPRHGKSLMCSQYLPSWYLGLYPDRRVILSSYEASFAATWGRKTRNLLDEHGWRFGIKIAESPSAADQWDIAGHEGGMMTAGAGGAITGKGCSLAICDDPHKNSEEAASQTMRDKVWDWFQSTLYTRLEPDGAIVVVQTRWHGDDLCGRLLADAATGTGEQWRVLRLPAINNDGQPLWPERFSLERLQQIKRAVGDYHWESLYQQNPTPREGSFFKVGNLKFIDASEVPRDIMEVRGWDFAATANAGDYTAGPKLGLDNYGRVYVTDLVRGQWATDERNSRLTLTAGLDGTGVRIRIPEDPGAAGKDAALSQLRLLVGYNARCVRVSGSKESRADPFSAQVNAGNVFVVRADWNRDFVEELRQFPRGKHDDIVDGCSDALSELANTVVWDYDSEPDYANV